MMSGEEGMSPSAVKWLRYGVIALISVILILGAQVLENITDTAPAASVFHSSHTWVGFLNELGFAFLIALVIIIGIEQWSRNEFNRTVSIKINDIQNNVFRSTFSRNIPKSLIDEVDNLVLRADFVRQNHRSTYRMRLVNAKQINKNANDTRAIIASVNTSYKVKNVSGVRKDFPVRVELEKSPIEGLEGSVSIQEIAIRGNPITENNLRKADEDAPDGFSFRKFEHVISGINPGEEVEVACKFQIVMRTTGTEVWRSLLPSDGMTLVVYLPPGAKNFDAFALHRAELTRRLSDEESGYHEWVLDQAVLPHQGIAFRWIMDDRSLPVYDASEKDDKKTIQAAVLQHLAAGEGPAQPSFSRDSA
jgi:hypothetical protein